MADGRGISRFIPPGAAALVLFLAAAPAIATPTTEPFVLLHVGPVVLKNKCASAPTTCAGVVTSGASDPTGQTSYYVYIAARNRAIPPENSLAGAEFGIDYETSGPGDGLVLGEWTTCATLQFPTALWPQPHSGDLIIWNVQSACQTGELAIAGYFYATPYAPSTLRLTPHPATGKVVVADCNSITSPPLAPAYWGHVSFGGATYLDHAGGHNPCLDGDFGWNRPPETTIVEGPAEGSEFSSHFVTFRWETSDDREEMSQASTRMDAEPWSGYNLSPSRSYSLDPGDHVFQARARDALGLEDPTPAIRHFRVAGATPVVFSDVRTDVDDGRLRLTWRLDSDEPVVCEVWRTPWGTDDWRIEASSLRPDAGGITSWSDDSAEPETDYAYRIVAVGRTGPSTYGPIRATTPAGRFSLRVADRHPGRGSIDVEYELPRAADIDLSIFDISGRRLRTLTSGVTDGGNHRVTWNGRDERDQRIASGVYWLVLRAEAGLTATRSVTIVR